jgi:glycosyltransferase involved in cell wall biosynthesis
MPAEVSVIIPVYNAENSIVRTLNSVIHQTYRGDLEIIIVNDGSYDKSKELIEAFISKNRHVNIQLYNQENSGVSAARNLAMRKATGKYIALLDADDEWLPGKLEIQIDILQQNEDIYLIGTNRNNEHFRRFFFWKFSRLNVIRNQMQIFKFLFVTPTVVFRKEVLNTVGWYKENQTHGEDGLFFMRICSKFKSVLLNESLVITGNGKPSFGHMGLSSNLLKMQKGELYTFYQARKERLISFAEFLFAVNYSVLKFIRRLVIVGWRKAKMRTSKYHG